eukprot:TRINITY_DN780_c0_g2_i1.p1 TRINITY_DN780_c0_g2~~TRINITY_DN780_c0_g2_i1.p1  ORF type:complete len:969 (+),score=428.67 TRINITY_DN780_c0_g2_i1:45-2951(+)
MATPVSDRSLADFDSVGKGQKRESMGVLMQSFDGDVAVPMEAMTMSHQQTMLWGVDRLAGDRPGSATYDLNSPRHGASPVPGGAGSPSFEDAGEEDAGVKLGTMKGVYLPCVQNILGVILFLRLPWIAAQAGVIQCTLVVGLCILSTVITSLSLAAIATNGQVQAGGPYFIISRNLGPEIGGSVGVIFYLGTTIAATMYILGAIEALEVGFDLGGMFDFQRQLLALMLTMVLAFIVFVGVKYVNMSAMFFLAVVILSIFCFMIGCIVSSSGGPSELKSEDFKSADNMQPAWEKDNSTGITPNFVWCIGLFYPSVTGIMAGSNRSAVLADAKKSIPVGTIGAIITTSTIYFSVIWLFGMTLSNDILKKEKLVVTLVAFPHKIVVNLGIIMSCVGAGLQCLTGAPRLLSAIANDDTMPILATFKTKGSDEPKKAVLLTYVIASIPCLAGNLDLITPIITMFFLMMYATVNSSCFLLEVMKAPGWRPTFGAYSWFTALFGAILCITMMVLIAPMMAFVCYLMVALMLVYIRSQRVERNWGDAIPGLRFQTARNQLITLSNQAGNYHPKNWRPQVLVLTKLDEKGNPMKPELVATAAMMKKGRGLLMCMACAEGDIERDYDRREAMAENLRNHMKEYKLAGFPQVVLYNGDVQNALNSAMQSSGCGAMQANTVLLGWPSWAGNADVENRKQKCHDLVKFVRNVNGSRKAVMMLKNGHRIVEYMARDKAVLSKTIDVWWIVHDGGLLLLVPHLMTMHKAWKGCQIRIFAVLNEYVDQENGGLESSESFTKRIAVFLDQVRIQAEVIPVRLTESELEKAHAGHGDDAVKLGGIYSGILKSRGNADVAAQVAKDDRRSRRAQEETKPSNTPIVLSGAQRRRNMPPVLQPPPPLDDDEYLMAQDDADNFTMSVARAFNQNMVEKSQHARLVVTNLPLMSEETSSTKIVDFVEELTRGLGPTMLIRGNGTEIVTSIG